MVKSAAVMRLTSYFDGLRAVAAREEDELWAISILTTKHRKRPFSLEVGSRALMLLSILHGEKQVTNRLGITRETLGRWLNVWLSLGGMVSLRKVVKAKEPV
jgi:hypothetical protein